MFLWSCHTKLRAFICTCILCTCQSELAHKFKNTRTLPQFLQLSRSFWYLEFVLKIKKTIPCRIWCLSVSFRYLNTTPLLKILLFRLLCYSVLCFKINHGSSIHPGVLFKQNFSTQVFTGATVICTPSALLSWPAQVWRERQYKSADLCAKQTYTRGWCKVGHGDHRSVNCVNHQPTTTKSCKISL